MIGVISSTGKSFPMISIPAVDPVRHDRHALGGTVQKNGVPVGKVLVVVCDRYTFAPFAVARTKPNGTWRIEGLVERPKQSLRVIVCSDDTAYNGEVGDWVSQGALDPPAPEEATT